ncbi:hypothetical protein J0H58_18280 [bacterium]|nr:hypothetical protein [bacterium]
MTRLLVPSAVLAVVLSAGCAGESADPNGPTEVLSGTVRLNGEPVDFVMLVATGPDGKSVTGPSLPGGRYRIEKPPAGKLRFKFASAPPGGAPKSGGPPRSAIPPKYFTDQNDLSFEYTGGSKSYDVVLQP